MRAGLLTLVVCVLCLTHPPATASVVMTGTRVIYPGALASKTLQLRNDDAHPYLVQFWLDAGDEDSTPDQDHGVPFTLSPPIFRMEPGSGQAVRLVLTDAQALPADRESLLYLNFSQLPALEKQHLEGNAMLMVVNSRLKLFYRPASLYPPQPDMAKMACALRFTLNHDTVQVDNPGAFHAVVSKATLVQQGRSIHLLEAEVVPPFSRQQWPLAEPITPVAGARIHISLINDYGAQTAHDCPWQ